MPRQPPELTEPAGADAVLVIASLKPSSTLFKAEFVFEVEPAPLLKVPSLLVVGVVGVAAAAEGSTGIAGSVMVPLTPAGTGGIVLIPTRDSRTFSNCTKTVGSALEEAFLFLAALPKTPAMMAPATSMQPTKAMAMRLRLLLGPPSLVLLVAVEAATDAADAGGAGGGGAGGMTCLLPVVWMCVIECVCAREVSGVSGLRCFN